MINVVCNKFYDSGLRMTENTLFMQLIQVLIEKFLNTEMVDFVEDRDG